MAMLILTASRDAEVSTVAVFLDGAWTTTSHAPGGPEPGGA
jgi:hypothetical protein